MMKGRIGFRAKTFLAVFGVSAAVLLLTAIGIDRALRQQTSERIVQTFASNSAQALDDLERQQRSVRDVTLAALGLALVCALALGWVSAELHARRMAAITRVAQRYSAGDLSPPRVDYGTDEVGTVAKALDGSVQALGKRIDELARHRARMEAILAGMIEGVLVIDAQGRVQLANRAASHILRLDAAPSEARHYLEAIRHPQIVEQLGTALMGTTASAVELSLGGEPERWFVARAAPVAAGGAVLVLHDITDLRRADQIRRDFVANISHELRTPLTAIGGYVEALLDSAEDTKETRRFLEVIARHTARMERLVKDLLRLARLDAGQERPEIVPCDTETLFAGVLAELAPALEARRQRAEKTVAPTAAAVQGDAAKLHDALHNLLENATNYAPEGSTIRLHAAANGESIVLSVADEGPGVSEADLPRIFERFYRTDKSRSRDPGGTGLGLAIVKHLVEVQGGHVSAANRPTGGALFTISLPRS